MAVGLRVDHYKALVWNCSNVRPLQKFRVQVPVMLFGKVLHVNRAFLTCQELGVVLNRVAGPSELLARDGMESALTRTGEEPWKLTQYACMTQK